MVLPRVRPLEIISVQVCIHEALFRAQLHEQGWQHVTETSVALAENRVDALNGVLGLDEDQ